MAAGLDEVYIRPRGRVLVGSIPLANTRWRERLERNTTTIALAFEVELRSIAAQAAGSGWPTVVGPEDGRCFPTGCLVGLRVGWVAWHEDGLERLAPDWSLRPDGRLVAEVGRVVATDELVANLVRLTICDDGGRPSAANASTTTSSPSLGRTSPTRSGTFAVSSRTDRGPAGPHRRGSGRSP